MEHSRWVQRYSLPGILSVVLVSYGVVLSLGGLFHIEKIHSTGLRDYHINEPASPCHNIKLFPVPTDTLNASCKLSVHKKYKAYKTTSNYTYTKPLLNKLYFDDIYYQFAERTANQDLIVVSDANLSGFLHSWFLMPLRLLMSLVTGLEMKEESFHVSAGRRMEGPVLTSCPRYMVPSRFDLTTVLLATESRNMLVREAYAYVSMHLMFPAYDVGRLISRGVSGRRFETGEKIEVVMEQEAENYVMSLDKLLRRENVQIQTQEYDPDCLRYYLHDQWTELEAKYWMGTNKEKDLQIPEVTGPESSYLQTVNQTCQRATSAYSTYDFVEYHNTSFYSEVSINKGFKQLFSRYGSAFSPWYLNSRACLAIGSSWYTYVAVLILWCFTTSFSESPVIVSHVPRLMLYFVIGLYRYVVLYKFFDKLESYVFVENSRKVESLLQVKYFDFSDHLVMLMTTSLILVVEAHALMTIGGGYTSRDVKCDLNGEDSDGVLHSSTGTSQVRVDSRNAVGSDGEVTSSKNVLGAVIQSSMDTISEIPSRVFPPLHVLDHYALVIVTTPSDWLPYFYSRELRFPNNLVLKAAVGVLNRVLFLPSIGVICILTYLQRVTVKRLPLYLVYFFLQVVNLYMSFYTALFFHSRMEVLIGYLIAIVFMYIPVYLGVNYFIVRLGLTGPGKK